MLVIATAIIDIVSLVSPAKLNCMTGAAVLCSMPAKATVVTCVLQNSAQSPCHVHCNLTAQLQCADVFLC
jgi:hypothetical protein